MNDTDTRTDFLFPKRGFFTGLSSILDIFSVDKKVNTSKSGEEADAKALKSDWEMIGKDFEKSLEETF